MTADELTTRKGQITRLKQCDGYNDFQVPFIQNQIDDLEKENLDGKCASYEAYLANCILIKKLKDFLANPDRELARVTQELQELNEEENVRIQRLGEMG